MSIARGRTAAKAESVLRAWKSTLLGSAVWLLELLPPAFLPPAWPVLQEACEVLLSASAISSCLTFRPVIPRLKYDLSTNPDSTIRMDGRSPHPFSLARAALEQQPGGLGQ